MLIASLVNVIIATDIPEEDNTPGKKDNPFNKHLKIWPGKLDRGKAFDQIIIKFKIVYIPQNLSKSIIVS